VTSARRALLAASLGFALASSSIAQHALPPAPAAHGESAPDVPAGDARIEGRVVQGDASTPVPDVEVILYALSPDGTPGLRRARSDANGAYAFERVSSTADVAYLVGARYRDIPVPGGRVAFEPGKRLASADIRVAELTSDLRGVHVRSQTLRLYREAESLRIEESFEIELTGAEIAYVAKRERSRKGPGLRATLPAAASDFVMPLGVIPEGLERADAAQRYFGPFYPGMQELSWSYRLKGGETTADGVRYRFEFTPAADVETFSVLVPNGVGAFDAPGLANAGAAEDNGRSATRFTAAHPRGPLTFSFVAPAARVDPGAISVHEVEIVMHADDAAINVTETHVVTASGSALLLGTLEAPLLRMPIPQGASDIRFGSDAQGLAFAPQPDGGVAVMGSLAPGEMPIQIAYRVPVTEAGARLTRSFGVRVPLLRVFVADTGRVTPSGARLHRAKPVRTEDLNYLGLEAFDVDAGEEVAIRLDPLPPHGSANPNVARALAGLAGVGLLAWVLLPFARRSGGAPAASERDEPARNEREAVYDAIRDLDHDYETAKLSAEDHSRLRDDLRQRAAALIRAEEAGAAIPAPGAAPAIAPTARACVQCHAVAAPEHRFCASCGAPLGAPAA
jgi:hypothetical protein